MASNRVRLYLIDEDRDYLRSLEDYFVSFCYERISIKTFSKTESLEDFIKKEDKKPDIILISENLYSESVLCENTFLLRLSDDTGNDEKKGIYKYSTGYEIESFVLSNLSDEKKFSFGENTKTCTISFFSPQGGSGKSMLSLLFATGLAALRKKVLYLPMEHFSDTDLYIDNDNEHSMSHIFLYLKENKNTAAKIAAGAKYDSAKSIYYYSPAINPFEITDMEKAELDNLFFELKNNLDYDYIIIDIESGVFPEFNTYITLSDIVLTVINNNKSGYEKLRKFIKVLNINESATELINKKALIINKYNEKENIQGHEYPESIFKNTFRINKRDEQIFSDNNFLKIYSEFEMDTGKILSTIINKR
jgi:cellulose biosynthesis protein BcsQ